MRDSENGAAVELGALGKGGRFASVEADMGSLSDAVVAHKDLLNGCVGLVVHAARSLVQDKNLSFPEECPCQAEQLTLTGAQINVVGQQRRKTVWEHFYHVE